jgi:tetratricopeptide (TPR) repeat protein
MKLPQEDIVWYCAARRLRAWIEDEKQDGMFYLPWMLIALNQTSGAPLAVQLMPERPSPTAIYKTLTAAMRKPLTREIPKHRPLRIHFEDQDLLEAVAPQLSALGIVAYLQPQLEAMAELVKMMQEDLMQGAPEIPGLLRQPGVKPELVRQLFEAASLFYRTQPWVTLSNVDLLEIRVGRQRRPYAVSVMGNAGQEYGLSVFTKPQDLERFFAEDRLLDAMSPQGHHVFFLNPPPVVSIDDVEAVEEHGWELPAPNIYPTPAVMKNELLIRPRAEMLRWYEAVLRAVPEFVSQHLQMTPDGNLTPAEAAIEVTTSAGSVSVKIRYPAVSREVMATWLDAHKDEEPETAAQDTRAFERVLAQMGALIGDERHPRDKDLSRAQELLYDAWDEKNPNKRQSLARQALHISPNCADAYVLLAEHARSRRQAMELYEQGVVAGKRALGEAFFQDAENVGHFWGLLETRPYMRAMEGLAMSLWEQGRRAEALAHLREMLRLNPNDNQGMRYPVINLLLEMNRLEDLEFLLRAYPDDASLDWHYTRALMAYIKHGDSPQAHRALQVATAVNPHVIAFLTGRRRIERTAFAYTTRGGEDEAEQYAAHHLNHWRRVQGAVAWLDKETR